MVKKKIVVAGGSGLVGKAVVEKLKAAGHEVYILSRKKNDLDDFIYWNPKDNEIDLEAIVGTQVLINLVGEGIADKRWTDERKKLLISSRVEPTEFLFNHYKDSKDLEHYVSASGINCYDSSNYQKLYKEEDEYGNDFLSHVVKLWEQSADKFKAIATVSKLRISMVLTGKGGALKTIEKPIKLYIGSPLGTGKQWMPWISLEDLSRLTAHVVGNRLEGTFNAIANSNTNEEFTKALAKAHHKPLFMPKVPAFILKLLLGEMSTMVLEGVQASPEKIKSTGFEFKYSELPRAFEFILNEE